MMDGACLRRRRPTTTTSPPTTTTTPLLLLPLPSAPIAATSTTTIGTLRRRHVAKDAAADHGTKCLEAAAPSLCVSATTGAAATTTSTTTAAYSVPVVAATETSTTSPAGDSPLHPTTVRCLCGSLATSFYRFLARFSGRRRDRGDSPPTQSVQHPPNWLWMIVLVSSLFSISDACSSRATPKPRPPAPTPRPNITFLTYACPDAYDTWYCLNGATCFSVIIGDSKLYNCECADGYMGQRCEFKDLDGSYLPSQHRIQLETASIASGLIIAVLLVFILCVAVYIRKQRRAKARAAAANNVSSAVSADYVDGVGGAASNGRLPPQSRRVFGNHAHPWREHLQRGHNTLAVPMDQVPSVAVETRQDCDSTDTWLEPHMTTVPGGDRLDANAPP